MTNYSINQTETEINETGFSKFNRKIYPNFVAIAVAIVFLLFAVDMIMFFSALCVWDDSFMFVRYADNFINHSRLSWNPQLENGTYGLTSPLYLLVVIPIRFFTDFSPAKTLLVSGYVCGIAFLMLLWYLLTKFTEGERKTKLISTLLVFFVIGAAIESLPGLFASGMDTAFALTFVTLYLLSFQWQQRAGSVVSVVICGVIGGLFFYVRPDLMIYSIIVPVTMMFSTDIRIRKNAFVILIITLTLCGIELITNYIFLNSWLPLPFYAKGTKMYGEFFTDKYRYVSIIQFLLFLRSYWPLFLVILVNLVVNRKNLKQAFNTFEAGVMLATLCFLVYYILFVVAQVMYYYQRFYYPTLPALAYLACISIARVTHKYSGKQLKLFYGVWTGVIITGLITTSAVFYNYNYKNWTALWSQFNLVDTREGYYNTYRNQIWFGLGDFAEFPDDLKIGSTEVGFISIFLPEKSIIDLTGLNETVIALNGFSADYLFSRYKPDIIYMPHPDYADMIQKITVNKSFRTNYEIYPTNSLALAVSRESKYYSRIAKIMEGYGKVARPVKDLAFSNNDQYYLCEDSWPWWLK